MEKLVFAQRFPFSEKSREYLKQLGIGTDKLPEAAVKRAALMVLRAFSGSDYSFEPENSPKELLEAELVAFPVAKMFVSLMRSPNMIAKFSLLIKKKVFETILGSKDPKEVCAELADDFKLKYSLSTDKAFFAEVPLLEYLRIYFTDDETKLLNRPVQRGRVLLTLNDFARFLSELSYARVFDSLPIEQKSIPKQLHSLAHSIDSQLVVIDKKNFDAKLIGKIDPSLFPPCMQVLYGNQLAGKKLSYWARLSLASFLYQLGMSKTELMSVQSKSPDFDRKIAEYHVDRIFEKQLSAPGCKKMREYGLNIPECDKECTYKHPVQYYLAKLRAKNRAANKNSRGAN